MTGKPDRPVPDPLRGLRGVFAATLALEAIAVLLALLVVTRVDGAVGPLGVGATVGIVLALAAALVFAAGMQRRPWGLGLALALQAVLIACWVLNPALGALGLVFALAWVALLGMRRGVRRRTADQP